MMKITVYELKISNDHKAEIILIYRGNENVLIKMSIPDTTALHDHIECEIKVPRIILESFMKLINE